MQIGSTGSPYVPAMTNRVSVPERAEKGPDRDHDGDEGAGAVAALTRPAPASNGRGGKVNIVA